MAENTERIALIKLSRSRKLENESLVSEIEENSYRALSETLMFLGNGVLSQPALFTSKMQQRLGNLKVQDVIDANKMTAEIFCLKTSIVFKKPNSVCKVKLFSLPDASHG